MSLFLKYETLKAVISFEQYAIRPQICTGKKYKVNKE
jgi:hypothetical protein